MAINHRWHFDICSERVRSVLSLGVILSIVVMSAEGESAAMSQKPKQATPETQRPVRCASGVQVEPKTDISGERSTPQSTNAKRRGRYSKTSTEDLFLSLRTANLLGLPPDPRFRTAELDLAALKENRRIVRELKRRMPEAADVVRKYRDCHAYLYTGESGPLVSIRHLCRGLLGESLGDGEEPFDVPRF